MDRETQFASLVPDAKYRYQSPPSGRVHGKKNAFLTIQSPLLYLETAPLLEKNTRKVFKAKNLVYLTILLRQPVSWDMPDQ